jgi:hypothetical protein
VSECPNLKSGNHSLYWATWPSESGTWSLKLEAWKLEPNHDQNWDLQVGRIFCHRDNSYPKAKGRGMAKSRCRECSKLTVTVSIGRPAVCIHRTTSVYLIPTIWAFSCYLCIVSVHINCLSYRCPMHGGKSTVVTPPSSKTVCGASNKHYIDKKGRPGKTTRSRGSDQNHPLSTSILPRRHFLILA